VIGLLLGMVAIFLAREAKGLLIGEAADPALVTGLREAASRVGIMRVGEVITVHNAPDQIVAAMSVDFDNRISAGDVERIIAEIEADVRKQFPTVTRLYIRPVEIEPVSLRR
jgi:divalent metal cation (Fe/Co/Zn/Cd) transporter